MRYQCAVCDSVNVSVSVETTAGDNVPAEISYECKTCGECAFFAYGHYDDFRFNFRLIDEADTAQYPQ